MLIMEIRKQLSEQIKRNSPLMLTVWGIYVIMFGLVVGSGKLLFNIPTDKFTKDPNTITHAPFYVGAISNLGVILWTASATLCIFSYVVLKQYKPESPFRFLMLHAGIITTILMLDDLYMWHEEMFPEYLKIPENFLYAFYAVYFSFFIIRFKNSLLQSEYLILVAAFLFLGVSVLMDDMVDLKLFPKKLLFIYKHETLFEDLFKSLGILTWFVYFSLTCFSMVLPTMKKNHLQRKHFDRTIK